MVELTAEGDSLEIVAGYTSGGLSDFTSTAAGKALLLDAYSAGGEITFINEAERSAVRIVAPKWALPMLANRLPDLFKEVPAGPREAARAVAPAVVDFRASVEEEIRSALLGPKPVISADYATSDAFILLSAPVPDSLREAVNAIPKRISSNVEEVVSRLPAERTLRFKSDLPVGAVIFASPVPGANYQQWFLMLLLDRVIHRVVRLPLQTTLPLTVRPNYYSAELPVPSGQFPEPLEENLLQELQRLQFTPANARDLASARQDALAYLDSKPVREWFASYDMLAGRDEGVQWIQSASADELRALARDLLIMNRVVASWAPKARQTSVVSEPLTPAAEAGPAPSGRGVAEGRGEGGATPSPQLEVPLATFPPHSHSAFMTSAPERLPSGVSIAASNGRAIFVSNGPMVHLDREFSPDDLKGFEQYRADRILVLAPAASLDRARQLWSAFRGNVNGEGGVSRGKVSSGDLPALFILKTILDLKLIETGWQRDVSILIDAAQGSDLQIQGPDEKRAQVLEWIKTLIAAPLPDAYFFRAREVAIHRLDAVRPDLQALTWERDPMGTIQDLETISARLVQDVARLYY